MNLQLKCKARFHYNVFDPQSAPEVKGANLAELPYVLHLNKRDLINVTPIDELSQELLKKREPVFEAVATNGTGVFDTLKVVAKQVLTGVRKG